MSNLGGYVTLTKAVKALGGPKKAAAIVFPGVAVGGYGVLRGVEAGLKKVVKAAVSARQNATTPHPLRGEVFTVTSDGTDGKGLTVKDANEYRVLEDDGEAVLIELLGDAENPYFTSRSFLATVSDFPNGGSADEA